MSWIAEYDTQGREFPTCVHVTKTTGTMTHGATYVPIEDGKAVRAENAKLREIIADFEEMLPKSERRYIREMLKATTNDNAKLRELVKEVFYELLNVAGGRHELTAGEAQRLMDRMHELRVEVDG